MTSFNLQVTYNPPPENLILKVSSTMQLSTIVQAIGRRFGVTIRHMYLAGMELDLTRTVGDYAINDESAVSFSV